MTATSIPTTIPERNSRLADYPPDVDEAPGRRSWAVERTIAEHAAGWPLFGRKAWHV